MRLLIKINVILVLALGAGLGYTAYVARDWLDRNAEEQILEQARLLLDTAVATRKYTHDEVVGELLKKHPPGDDFVKQSIPAYANRKTLGYLRDEEALFDTKYRDYRYKEAALNPTNKNNKADKDEEDMIHEFQSHKDRKEATGKFSGRRELLYLARPIRAVESCLSCHGKPADAPAAMLQSDPNYTGGGFGWEPNTVVAVQYVVVPTSVPRAKSEAAFQALVTHLGLVALVTLGVLDVVLVAVFIRPVTRLSAWADQVSRGKLSLGEMPVRGSDEVARLTASFNRMYVSLSKVIHRLKIQ